MTGREIIDRLEKLTGPSREMDADIYEALGYEVKRKPERIVTTWRAGWSKSWAYFDSSTRRWIAMGRLTHSLDAIVALIEQKLPGWKWSIYGPHPELGNSKPGARLWKRDPTVMITEPIEEAGATPTIACCIVLLWALKAMEAGQ